MASGPIGAGHTGCVVDPDSAPLGDDRERASRLRQLEAAVSRSGHAVADLEHRLVPAWRARTRGEPRWIVSLAVAGAIALQLALPRKLALPPTWLLPAAGLGLLIGLLAVNPNRIDRRSRVVRSMSIGLTIVLSLANAASAARLIANVVNGHMGTKATPLLWSGASIWSTNVIVFSLWFWELDRGGPADRAHGVHHYPDFLFPQMTAPEFAPADWEPQYIDYLYLSFTNATAFSPTDVLPMVRWAKMTMLLQSAVSLSTVALVIARAINIL